MDTVGIVVVAAIGIVVAATVGGLLARAGFPVPDERLRFGCLDGLRGYLALAVMVHHYAIWSGIAFGGGKWVLKGEPLLEHFGSGGVALFFMITGFVFYPRILKGISGVDWVSTYVTRVWRLYPAAIISYAAVVLFIVAHAGTWPDLSPRNFALLAFKVLSFGTVPDIFGYPERARVNASVTWSLQAEIIFYVALLPLLAGVRQLTKAFAPSWVPIAAVWIVTTIACTLTKGTFFYLSLFTTGMLTFELCQRERLATWLRSPPAGAIALVALAAALMLPGQPLALPHLPVYGLFFACVAAGNSFWGALTARCSLVLGEASYSIYLFHGIALSILFQDVLPDEAGPAGAAFGFVLTMAAVTLFSAGMFIFVEKPGIRIGRELVIRLGRRKQTGADVSSLNPAP